MYSFVFFGFLALVAAAPHYHHHRGPPPFPHDGYNSDEYFKDEIFDTRRFWDGLRREMFSLEAVLADMSTRFATQVSTAQIDGNSYKVTIPLSAFEEKDIVVKARKGMLMVQAVKRGDGYMQNSYMDLRSLPEYVNEAGSWTFNNGVLIIVFPLVKNTPTDNVDTEDVKTTSLPDFSREEMENHSNESKKDIDVGSNKGVDEDVNYNRADQMGNNNEKTNEIEDFNNVEATTYAVDLKDEVEFVPMRYK